MDPHIKAFIYIFIIVIICIVIFSFIYVSINEDDSDPINKGYLNSLYTSVTIQTNIGMKGEPTTTALKYWIMIQSILSYVITLGFAYVLLKYIMIDKQKK